MIQNETPLSPSPLPRLGLLRCPAVGICAGRLEPHQGRERQPRGGDRELRGERVRQAFWGKADAGQGIKGRDSGRGRHQLPPGPQGQEWIHHGQLPSHRAGEALAPFQESHFLQTPSFLDPYFLSLSLSLLSTTHSHVCLVLLFSIKLGLCANQASIVIVVVCLIMDSSILALGFFWISCFSFLLSRFSYEFLWAIRITTILVSKCI